MFPFNTPELADLRVKLRTSQTKAEARLWKCIRFRQLLGFKFRRQFGVGRYILDFYCPQAKLAIEADGSVHDSIKARAYDRIRDEYISSKGITILRFQNNDIFGDMENVILKICDHLSTGGRSKQGQPSTFSANLLLSTHEIRRSPHPLDPKHRRERPRLLPGTSPLFGPSQSPLHHAR